MSAEFSAKSAREITNNKEYDIEKWYAKYKDKLFYEIQLACLDGHSRLSINSEQWQHSKLYKQHLITRLAELGYKTDLRNIWNYEELIISW